MEFFERAHVAKQTDSSAKDSKSDENMKKQLKRMLYGYKNSDNEAIINAAEMAVDPDDSTSVSGFSDLNITNSTIDADASYNTVNSEEPPLSSDENIDDLSVSAAPKTNDEEVNRNDTVSVSITSLSECDDDLDSLSDLPCEVHESSSTPDAKSSPIFSHDSSFVEITTDSETEHSKGTDSFDTDGILAAEIHSKLEKTGQSKITKIKRKQATKTFEDVSTKKHKYKGPYRPHTDDSSLDISGDDKKTANSKISKKKINNPIIELSTSSSSLGDEEIKTDLSTDECPILKKSKLKKKHSKESAVESKYKGPFNPNKNNEERSEESSDISSPSEYKGPYRPPSKERLTPESLEYMNTDESSSELSVSKDSPDSSPFVSINASEVACESLGDILGDYNHPTIKNLPSDTNCNFDLELFAADEMTVDDVLIEEDADSLVPEVPDDIAIEDLEDLPMETMELDEELDLSPQLIEEDSTTDCNTTFNDTLELQSQDVVDRESTESFDTTLVESVKVYYAKSKCIFTLKHPTQIFLHGKVKVKTLGSKIEILGHTLKDDTYEIYAPNYNYAQYIKTVENESTYNGLFGKLTSNGLSVAEAEEIVTSLEDNDAVICMQPLRSRTMDFVEENFSMSDLFSKASRSIANCFKKASEILGCSLYLTKPYKCFAEEPAWKVAVQLGMINLSKVIACGGKGVGKSTFLRYYVNRLLAQGPVLVVDLDPGQAEFTPAGNVAATVVTQPLLGPSYTHLKTPEIMLNLGMINVMENVKRYASALHKLITHCSNDVRLQNMPWVINTMGMTNAIGLQFITLAIILTKPSHLLQIDSKNPKKRYAYQLTASTVKDLCYEKFKYDSIMNDVKLDNLEYTFLTSRPSESGVKNNFSLAPRDERYLNYLAYFGQVLTSKERGLLDIIPYEVNLNSLYVGVNVGIPEDAAATVLNGKVVALCTVADPPRNRLFVLSAAPLLCHGHGLVRGIDWDKGVLYIITPAGDKLKEVNTLVYADWVPEIRGTEAQLPAGLPVPYRTASLYQQRHFMFAPKRRFNPLQLIKMSRTD